MTQQLGTSERSGSLTRALRVVLCAVALAVAPIAMPAMAMGGAIPDCEAIAARIGAVEGMPAGLLPAIARIESGRRVGEDVRAWPWTLNHAGKGLYFDTQQEALAYLSRTVAEGPSNIDVGCMQVNHYWHGSNFASVEAMLDPETNIRYAVRFLKELYASEGSWDEAVAHYHSPDPDRGAKYHLAFETARAAIDPDAARRGDMMSVTGVSIESGPAALRAGGLFGMALPAPQGGIVDYGAMVAAAPTVATESPTESAYAALLAFLAERDGATLSFFTLEVAVAEGSRSSVLNRNWGRVQEFRELLRTAP
ncbi:MAG: lytic transglycosylase domain-containing protein [Marivivens sp.]